jgi:VanZ family protein
VSEDMSGDALPSGAIVIPPRPALPEGWRVVSAADGPQAAASGQASARARSRPRWARMLLAGYLFALTLIALWPVPVDSGAGPMLRLVGRVLPLFTHARIEFGANILLFVPLGILLALILTQRHLVVPIAFLATVAIESMQALMIDRRVPSVMDIIANVAGACLGLVIVACVEWWRGRRERVS